MPRSRPSKLLANPAARVLAIGVAGAAILALVVFILVARKPEPLEISVRAPIETPAAARRAAAGGPAALAPHDPVFTGFDRRVQEYVALRQKLSAGLAPLGSTQTTTASAAARENDLASRIQAARSGAKPGDIFGDSIPVIQDIIATDAKSRAVADAYAAMQEVPTQSPPAVNAAYPKTAELATMPPLILLRLPALPDGLEFRFMGRALILHDTKANLIIDFVPEAVPIIRGA